MNPRLLKLKRIESLYGMVEEAHSIALRQSAALLSEAKTAITEQCSQISTASNESRFALLRGDRQQWLLAAAQRELGRVRRQQLEAVRFDRETATNLARDEYGASRVKSEQIKSVVERSTAEGLLAMSRQTQSTTDDRFLSRMRWNSSRLEER